MQYEIINPSDKATIEHDDPLVASVAVLILSNGAYALRGEDDSEPLPILMFGGEQELASWLGSNGIKDLAGWMECHRSEVADALDSVMYGSFADRAAYRDGLELIEDDSKRDEWRRRWADRRRTSLTDICGAAWGYAAKLRGSA